MSRVKLAMYKGVGGPFNALIRKWTGSMYSHCELVIDGECYSSSLMDKGVRRKAINLQDKRWDVIDVEWADADYALVYFQKTRKQNYGVWSLVSSQLFNLNRRVGEAPFCSQWCGDALRIPNAVSFSPHTLMDLVAFVSSAIRSSENSR